jgi:hypothetical protein
MIMENQVELQSQNLTAKQEDLPRYVGVRVLGILSLSLSWCYGLPGIILAIVALVMSSQATTNYVNNPGKYSEHSFNRMKSGKSLAIAGLIVSIFFLVLSVVAFYFFFSYVFHHINHEEFSI